MHCKSAKNHCQGITGCACICERCIEADRLASEVAAGVGYEEIESPASTDHFENLGDEEVAS